MNFSEQEVCNPSTSLVDAHHVSAVFNDGHVILTYSLMTTAAVYHFGYIDKRLLKWKKKPSSVMRTINSLGSDYTRPEIFELAALFSRLIDPPFSLIGHENGACRKRSSNRTILKTPLFRFRVDEKHFENRAFWRRWRHNDHVISLTESKMTGGCWVFKLLMRGVNGKRLLHFQSEISDLKFLWRRVYGI